MKAPYLADDLFLISLDETTGRHRLASQLLSLGLAGGLLGELLLDGAVQLVNGRLRIAEPLPRSGLTHMIRDRIEAEPQHDLHTWLRFVAKTATDGVADRLSLAGWIRFSEQGGLFRKAAMLYDPASTVVSSEIAWRSLRLSNLLGAGAQATPGIKTWHDALLAMLCHAVGLTSHLLRDGGPQTWDYVDEIHKRAVQEGPALHEVAIRVGELVGTATFTHT